jgi:glycosyltransferase involved in cell wall biosynthesis
MVWKQATALIAYNNEAPSVLDRTARSALAVCGEVVICDDASTIPLEHTGVGVTLLGEGCRIVRNAEPLYPSGAFAAAFKESSGSLICRLDTGDIWFPREKLEQIALTDRIQRPTFSLSRDEAPKTRKARRISERWMFEIYDGNVFQASSWVMPRSVWEKYPPDHTLRYSDDWAMAVKIQHYVGWVPFPKATGTATEWPSGHSDVKHDSLNVAIRAENIARARAMARELKDQIVVG